jgi:hypothetical protein
VGAAGLRDSPTTTVSAVPDMGGAGLRARGYRRRGRLGLGESRGLLVRACLGVSWIPVYAGMKAPAGVIAQ